MCLGTYSCLPPFSTPFALSRRNHSRIRRLAPLLGPLQLSPTLRLLNRGLAPTPGACRVTSTRDRSTRLKNFLLPLSLDLMLGDSSAEVRLLEESSLKVGESVSWNGESSSSSFEWYDVSDGILTLTFHSIPQRPDSSDGRQRAIRCSGRLGSLYG